MAKVNIQKHIDEMNRRYQNGLKLRYHKNGWLYSINPWNHTLRRYNAFDSEELCRYTVKNGIIMIQKGE